MISIICPVYNNDKYLDDCINSVLLQSLSEWELLLIDDGSTDYSPMICDKYAAKDNRIKVFHKANEGQWLTREYGINKASGNYFIFLDSDDMLELDSLKKLNQTIEEHHHPDAMLYDICKLNPDESKTCLQELYEEKQLNNTKDIIDFCFVKNNCISLCVYCFKKDFYLSCTQENKIDKTIRSQEDFLMLFEILQQLSELIVIPKILYIYRTNKNSVSSTLCIEDYYKNIFISDFIYKTIFDKYNDDLTTYANKIIQRLAWQPISFIKRAYRELKKKERNRLFLDVRKSFIYNNFTKRYKFDSKRDRYLLFFFKAKLHFVNKLFLCKEAKY